ncbi:hypothetical protein [Actinoalloteichus caeruleus]|uniref:Uncharacterized protein n=1 Tax=Actinoalloteichus caeruleus DSM 43889 TaxID=1120930 RepID=A0ABT1JET2_ACTCY|nr:hypothetical protein [Actinoalloteichus caeruleus]MCP2331010.1 hypothetical protein [Actinoalloteichus caeruleus DSM 43889]
MRHRILAELDSINRRIDAHHGEHADARAHLDDALNLLESCADIYNRCDDANRRLCNQAFFTKVYIDEDDELRVENNRPFEMLLAPQVNANALNWTQNSDKARTPTNDSVGKGSSLVRGMDSTCIEPPLAYASSPSWGARLVASPCGVGNAGTAPRARGGPAEESFERPVVGNSPACAGRTLLDLRRYGQRDGKSFTFLAVARTTTRLPADSMPPAAVVVTRAANVGPPVSAPNTAPRHMARA